jgi:hypothetical protein
MSSSVTSHIPILLSSSVVAYDKGVRLQDPADRTRLALESIHWWRSIAPNNPLVLCDGSDFNFQPLLGALPGIGPVETLHFQNNVNLIDQHGRGYGEGEIVRYAIEHSTLIQSAGCFAKCTSKLWVQNFTTCMRQWNGNILMKAVFDDVFSISKPATLAYIDTRFYAMRVEEYQQYFLHAHQSIRVGDGHGLEECFRDIFLKNKLKNCLMSPPPVIAGVGGGTGVYYENGLLRRLKEKWRYQRVRRNPLFRSWFA